MKFHDLGGFQSQLWSGNHVLSAIPHDLGFDPLASKSKGHIINSWEANVWCFIIIGGLQSQLWSGNYFQSSMPLDLLTQKSIGYILDTWGASVWSFMIIGGLRVSYGPETFSIINAPMTLTFGPKINRANPWHVESKRMKFNDHRWIT